MIKHLKYGLTALALTVLPVLANAPASHATTTSPGSAATTFHIVSRFSNRCLTANGDNVEVTDRSVRPVSSQDWYWEGTKLVNYAEAKCLDVRNGELDAPAQNRGDWSPHAGINLRNCEDTATWQRRYTKSRPTRTARHDPRGRRSPWVPRPPGHRDHGGRPWSDRVLSV